jgi:hypothetical protein
MASQSSVGNLVDLKEDELLLPGYLQKQQDGIYVSLPTFPVGSGFDKFIDRLFSDGFRFVNLDYQLLMDLLYDYGTILDEHGMDTHIRLADDIIRFPAKRKALYRGVKLDDEFLKAEYFFEPVEIEVEIEVPVYGEEGTDGIRRIVGSEVKLESKPTSLNVDEFVAELWLKGVRFGIDVDKVADVIARQESVRLSVAAQQDVSESSDAEIEEANVLLHRDNAPKILPNGKADLRKFQNRFPQIEAGARLLKKKSGVPGKPGFKINGARIEPEIPQDVDLQVLAGIGTAVEIQDGEEYIVATRNGFLALDVVTNHIEVTEKIENKAGVNIKTTGDLSLAGKEFIEHGEVQEGRVVEGTNMTFRSNVFGALVSKGGLILLEKSLSNGSAKSLGGNVTSHGRSFNSVIEAHEGHIALKYAEACQIAGKSVAIEHAINCEIIAESIEINTVEGCGLAGKSIRINSSNASRGNESNISVVLPDLSVFEAQIRQLNKSIEDCKLVIQKKDQELAQICSNAEVAKYLALASSVKQSSVKLTAAHQENWAKMTAKFAKVDNALDKLNADKQEQLKRIQTAEEEIAYLMEGRALRGKGIYCKISNVAGDTLVRTMAVQNGIPELYKSKPSEIKVKLREQGSAQARLFYSDEGSLDWEYTLPEIEPLPS